MKADPAPQGSMTAHTDGATTVRLTQRVKAGGCASKLAPRILHRVLSGLPLQQDENVLVGFGTADDAGVYRLSDTQALVQTVDFFTPMVDSAYTFGQIAATNALNDVYAMGGKPLTALCIVCFPQEEDSHLLGEMMRGGLAVMSAAGCAVVGGHSVRDPEIKFGYAVTGLIDPRRVLTNSAARAGDALLLTKRLGTGVITTALKRGEADGPWVEAATASMLLSNKTASEIVVRPEFEVHAMTDVTGFGLMGHARGMALGSGVRLSIEIDRVPLLEGARAACEAGCIPGGLLANREFAECMAEDQSGRGDDDCVRKMLYDPQTAGGLLIAAEAGKAESLLVALRAAGYPAERIGTVFDGDAGIVLH
jgi:selenide,water dikinase